MPTKRNASPGPASEASSPTQSPGASRQASRLGSRSPSPLPSPRGGKVGLSHLLEFPSSDSLSVTPKPAMEEVNPDVPVHATGDAPNEPIDTEAGEAGGGEMMVGRASVAASAFNLASTALGAGTLGLPYAFAQTGMIIGPIALFLSCGGTIFAISLLVNLVNRSGRGTYESLADYYFGKWAKTTVAIVVVTMAWGFSCMYVLVVGSLMEPVQDLLTDNTSFPTGFWGLKIIQIIFWAIFMLPLSLMRDINSLRYPSAAAAFTVMLVVVALIIHLSTEVPGKVARDNLRLDPPGNVEFIQALSNIKVAFSGQSTSFAVYAELADHTVPLMTGVTAIAMVACAILYCVAGTVGLACFGGAVEDNVLDSFTDPLDYWYVLVAYCGMAFTITFSFPIMMFPTRDAVLQLLGHQNAYVTPVRTRLIVSAALATSALVVGMFVPSLNLMFGVIGGISGNLIAYVFPALLALKAGWTVKEQGLPSVIGVWTLLISGIILGPLGTGVALYLQFKPDDNNSPAFPVVNSTNASSLLLP